MKRLIALVLAVGVSAGGSVFASSHKDKDYEHRKFANPEMKVERMAEKLSLTEEQQAEVLRIMETQHEQRKQMREAMRESRKKTHDDIKQLLNDEQLKKYQKMLKKKYKDMKDRRHEECDD